MSRSSFEVWAPVPAQVELCLKPVGATEAETVPMERDAAGWWRPAGPLPADGVGEFDYGFRLDGADLVLPDPRSRRQPDGVHGWSRTFDPTAYAWSMFDERWTGRQLAGGVIYELHVGTFTPEGTLRSAIDRLDHLVDLGIDIVELMPVNAFNGTHNWGYDGVAWYAVQETYGGPRAYQELVDACHARGLAVVQDVVYNHLGPSGNYLPQFGPYLSTGLNTWGASPNLDGPDSDEVRRYLLDNLLMWVTDYHVDGFRLDAVHALHDDRALPILEEMAVEMAGRSAFLGRPLPLIAESDLNNPRLITARDAGGYGLDGQWSDDFHHALYVSLTGDTSGYYADFGSLAALGKVFTQGFFHNGTTSSFRHRGHGRPIDTLRTPTWRLVVCADNHDQIGNRADGRRLSGLISPAQQALAALVTLLSPFTPMIFMGEEWGATTPWPFFTSHPEEDLGEAVRLGRLEEFAAMAWDTGSVPDPQDPQTFASAKLDWAELTEPDQAYLLGLTRRLLELRRSYPDLTDPRFDAGTAGWDDEAGWLRLERGTMTIAVNFSDAPTAVPVSRKLDAVLELGEVKTTEGEVRLGPHSALVARTA